MLRLAVISMLLIGAASSPPAFVELSADQAKSGSSSSDQAETELIVGSSSADQAETESIGKPKYAPHELKQKDFKRMSVQQQQLVNMAKQGKRWAMHGAREAGEAVANTKYGADQKTELLQNRLENLGELPKRVAQEGKARFNRALGRDVEHPFGNPQAILGESQRMGMRKLANKNGLHSFLRDMTLTEEQKHSLDRAENLAYEAGKKGKTAVLARMGIKPREKPDGIESRMYQSQILASLDMKDENIEKTGCAVHGKDRCDLIMGCKWIHHRCNDRSKHKSEPNYHKIQSNELKHTQSVQMKPFNNLRGGHGIYGHGLEKMYMHTHKAELA